MEKASLSVSFVKANLKAISQHGLDEAQAHERPMNVKGGQNLFYLESRANKGTKKLDSDYQEVDGGERNITDTVRVTKISPVSG